MNGLGSKEQIEQFHSFHPDLAVLPELKQKNIDQLSPDEAIWNTNNFVNPSPKGLGVLAFNGISIRELPTDKDMEIYTPISVKKDDFEFSLLAIWNFYSACKQGRFKGVKGENCLEWEAMRHYKKMMRDPFLMIGDFNFGPTFSQAAFQYLCETLSESEVESLYHQYFNLPKDSSKHPTFRTPNKIYHHLDQVFGSNIFSESLISFNVTPFEKVVKSDHAPILVEFDL